MIFSFAMRHGSAAPLATTTNPNNPTPMAAAPYYKAHTPERGYVASFKYIEDAAQFAASNGEGVKIFSRWGTLLWHEGHEDQPALESYDHVAEVAASRDNGTINPQNT